MSAPQHVWALLGAQRVRLRHIPSCRLEEKLAAVQFLFTQELDKAVKLWQEKHD